MSNWTNETRGIELRNVPLEENRFEGLACRYNVEDSYGTRFVDGCFARGGLDKNKYSLLWMHDPTQPIGTFTAEERSDGLYIVGEWDSTPAGIAARMSALSGSASDLSVGFLWKKEEGMPENDITIAKLQEVSQVTSRFGAVPGSVLTAVRSAIDALEHESERYTTEYPNQSDGEVIQGSTEAEEAELELEAEVGKVDTVDQEDNGEPEDLESDKRSNNTVAVNLQIIAKYIDIIS
jgi:HK97 family phage prohead protease